MVVTREGRQELALASASPFRPYYLAEGSLVPRLLQAGDYARMVAPRRRRVRDAPSWTRHVTAPRRRHPLPYRRCPRGLVGSGPYRWDNRKPDHGNARSLLA